MRLWGKVFSGSLVLAAVLGAEARSLRAQDLVLLRSGERRTGSLAACVGDRCTFAGKALPRADIAWIGLGVSGSPPLTRAGAGEDELWLADGTSRRGAFAGLSLGEVSFAGETLDREAVRWIRLTAPGLAGDSGQQPIERDVLLRRDGARRQGELQACDAAGCAMGNETTPRGELAWIGVGVDPEQPPPAAPAETALDAVQLADATLRTAPLVGISATTVTTQRGAYSRSDVDWIYLAPPGPGSGSTPGRNVPPASAPPAPTAEPPRPSPAPPLPPPTPSGPPAQPTGARGALWRGTIEGRYRMDDGYVSYLHTFVTQVRAREAIHPVVVDGKTIYQSIGLWGGEASFAETYTRQEHFAGGHHCDGSGETRSTGGENLGWLWVKTRDVDLAPHLGFDLPAGGGYYQLSPNPPFRAKYPLHCRDANGTWSTENSFLTVRIGRHPGNPWSEQALADPEVRYLEGGRMRGSYETTTGSVWHSAVAWSLCREGEDCPSPPSLPGSGPPPPLPPPGPCDETAADRAQLDVRIDQWRRAVEAARRAVGEFERLQQQAAQWAGDYEHAMRDCNLWDAAFILIGLGTSGLAGPNQPAAFQEMVNFFDLVDKVTSGDPSWLLPNADLETSNTLEGVTRKWISLEDAWDIATFSWANLGESAPQALRERLQSCGAPTLEAVLDGAYGYLRLVEQLQPLADRMHELTNNVRDKEEGIFDFCLRHPQACADYGPCRPGAAPASTDTGRPRPAP